DNRERIYPIRCIRDDRYSFVWSPNHKEITSNISISKALALIQGQVARPDRPDKAFPATSWVEDTKGDPLDDPLVKKLHHRPEYALYDLRDDPHELTNLADHPKHKETASRLRHTLFAWLEKHGDADPITTERKITQNKGAKPKKKGGKKK
ncbi:MAG: hypothetical protein HN727_05405, partial [Opitutae bacterium]|nr:hypothetical protein [Opitutae bacterium]